MRIKSPPLHWNLTHKKASLSDTSVPIVPWTPTRTQGCPPSALAEARFHTATMDEKAVPSDPPPAYIAGAAAQGVKLRQSAPARPGPAPFQLPIITHLKSKRVILASSSPRRKALLAQVRKPFLFLVPFFMYYHDMYAFCVFLSS